MFCLDFDVNFILTRKFLSDNSINISLVEDRIIRHCNSIFIIVLDFSQSILFFLKIY